MIKKLIMLIALSTLITLTGCNNEQNKNIDRKVSLEIIEVSKQETDYGINYYAKVKFSANGIIKQNNIYLYYPLSGNTQYHRNIFKSEAIGNKLNIEPNEVIDISWFIPIEEVTEEIKDQIPRLHVIGYINEFEDINRFEYVGYELKKQVIR